MSAKRSQSGFAMLAVMLAMVVIGGLVCAATARTRLLARGTVLDRGRMLTFHAASGGLSRARHALARDPLYRGEELVVGSCRVKIETTPTATATATAAGAGERWQVAVTASHRVFGSKAAPVRHRIDAVLEAGSGLPALLAFHGSDG